MTPMILYFTGENVPKTGSYQTIDQHRLTQQLTQGSTFPRCAQCQNPVGWIQV